MSETKSETPPKTGISGWLKTAVAGLLSALSGAALMYASPVLDMIIKPAKPIANFESQANGLKVTFQNKSTGGHEGWWDFGDGSALEPFAPEQTVVTHDYAKPGGYSVKLELKNLIGDENDRTVTLTVVEGGPTLPSVDLHAAAIQSDYAPATFRIESTVKNANLCVWAVGNRELEFSPDTANGEQMRFMTFKEPGTHIVKLAAYNGKQHAEKTVQIDVKKAPVGTMTATVDVTYEAALVEQKPISPVVQMRFPMDQKGDVVAVQKPVAADLGFEIIRASLVQAAKNPNIKSAKVDVDPAKRDVAILTCELVRPSARKPAPVCTVQLLLTEQRQLPAVTKTPDPVSANMTLPGSTSVPVPALPPGWVVKSRKMTLTLQQDGKQFAWKDGNMPHNVGILTVANEEYLVDTVEQNGILRIDMQSIKKALSIIGH